MFTIAWKDIRIRFKDRKAFITLFAMPLLLTAILGSALGGMFSDGGSIPEMSVGVFSVETNETTERFIGEVLSKKNKMKIDVYHSNEELKEAVRLKEVDAGLVLPVGWGEDTSSDAVVLKDPGKGLHSSIVQSMAFSFISQVQEMNSTTRVFARELEAHGEKEIIDEEIRKLIEEWEEDSEEVLSSTEEEKQVTGMEYYAVAMGVMFVLFNATLGAKSMVEEREIRTLSRIQVAPVRSIAITGGKFIGVLITSFLQFVIFMIATYYLFDVFWGGNGLALMAIVFSYSIAVAGVALLFASLIKDSRTADSAGGVAVQIMALLGGSMIPIGVFPEALQQISYILPNRWALDGILDVMEGSSMETLIYPVILLGTIGFVTLIISSIRLNMKEGV